MIATRFLNRCLQAFRGERKAAERRGKTRRIGDRSGRDIPIRSRREPWPRVTVQNDHYEIVDRWGAVKRPWSVLHRSANHSGADETVPVRLIRADSRYLQPGRDLRFDDPRRNSISINTRWKLIIDRPGRDYRWVCCRSSRSVCSSGTQQK